ncbi:hypothetical protein [Caldinitratiruptor microaerophilus]|uniref:hypothetical protein n=1 Tax=Caldinitratiruptor microaerophilus TaxID=671077 RepID=UPI002231C4A4|nr:hypothetical protein [Caldinitratiruptor microaerophilus]
MRRSRGGARRVGPLLLTLLALLSPLGGCAPRWGDLEVTVSVAGDEALVTFVRTGVRLSGGRHLHLSLNGGPEIMLYSDRPYRFRRLPPGDYTLRVWITDVNHRTIPGLETVVTFTVPKEPRVPRAP